MQEGSVEVNERFVVGSIHIRRDWSRINGIDSRTLSELTRPRSRHGLKSSFRTTIDTLANISKRRADGRKIHNTSGSIVRQIRQGCLQQEKRASNVDVVLPRKILAVYSLNSVVSSNASVVDDDINLEFSSLLMGEVVLRNFYDVLRTVLVPHVCLHGNGLDIVF